MPYKTRFAMSKFTRAVDRVHREPGQILMIGADIEADAGGAHIGDSVDDARLDMSRHPGIPCAQVEHEIANGTK
jgi:hypothetical protein